MATSNVSVGFRMAASFPQNQYFPATLGGIFTDTETQPGVSTTLRSLQAISFPTITNRQTLLKKRNISAQTKVFRTDQDNGAVDFSSTYTTVQEDLL